MTAKAKYVELSTKLREYRKKANMTQQQVADMLHISRTTITGYERGSSEHDRATLRKLAAAYKISTDELLGMVKPDVAQVKKEIGKELLQARVAMKKVSEHLGNVESLLDKL